MIPSCPQGHDSSSLPKPKRGNTCLNCRRRKIRCDGTRPICDHCTRGGSMFEDCEYPNAENPSQVQLLEERIAVVKNRIRSLEIPENMPEITLFDPYNQYGLPPNAQGSSSSSPLVASYSSTSLPYPTAARLSPPSVQEPPPEERRRILDLVFSYNHQSNFFLDLNRFWQSMVSSGPVGSHDRPCPSLITVIYLWGIFLSPTASKSKEKALLHNVLFYLSGDLSRPHPHRTIHCIQAEVLLSSYYLKNGKTLEGKHHAEVALSLAIGRGFHRIRSSRAPLPSQPPNSNSLTVPADVVEEGERIDAFWAAVSLNNCWSALQESHLTFSDLQHDVVDTPWPLDSYQHDSHHLPRKSLLSLQEFLNGSSVTGISEKALYIKATILLARAISVHRADNGSSTGHEELARLDSLIETFKNSLPLMDRPVSSPSFIEERRILTQMLVHAAMIRLHFPLTPTHSDSRFKSIQAAQAIAFLTMNTTTAAPSGIHADPVLGIAWVCAIDVLMQHVMNGGSTAMREQPARFASLETLLNQLTKFSKTSQLFKDLLTRVESQRSSNQSPVVGVEFGQSNVTQDPRQLEYNSRQFTAHRE